MKFKVLALAFFVSFFSLADAQILLHPYNLDFEIGFPNDIPSGWQFAKANNDWGYQLSINTDTVASGKQAVRLIGNINDIAKYGIIIQSIDAKAYRGAKIRFKSAMKTQLSVGASANIWIHVYLAENKSADMQIVKDTIATKDWQYYTVTADVDKNAELINIGYMLIGGGKIIIDNGSFEIVYPEKEYYEPPTALSPQGVKNLTAFAKLYSPMRYFYPGFEAKVTDWEKFALLGVEYVETAKNQAELEEKLNDLYLPVAPGVMIYHEEKKSKYLAKIEKPKNAVDRIALSKLNVGPELTLDLDLFSNEIVNLYKSLRDREAAVTQVVNASPFLGKKAVFSAKVKANVIPVSGNAQLWIRVDKPNDEIIYTGAMFDNPITKNEWNEYSISADIPQDAAVIRLGLIMMGEGEVWFDDAKLTVQDNNSKDFMRNGGFEDNDTGKIYKSWQYPPSCESAGYYARITNDEFAAGTKCLHIYSTKEARVTLPDVGETYSESLPSDLQYTMPVAVFADSSHTLPIATKSLSDIKSKKPDTFIYSCNDRTSRLAITTMLWSFYKQFALRYDNNCDWDNALAVALQKAALDKDKDDFRETLSAMLAKINDNQSRIWIGSEDVVYGFPFLWKFVDNKLIITKVAESKSKIQPGDEIVTIDNKIIAELINQKKLLITGNNEKYTMLRVLAELRAGDKDSPAIIGYKRDGKEAFENILRSLPLSDLTEARPEKFTKLDENTYYIDATSITDKGMKKILPDIKDAKNIIFDLRGNSSFKEDFLGLFSSTDIMSVQRVVPAFAMPDRKMTTERILQDLITRKTPHLSANIIFLADQRSYGQSEVILSIVKLNRLGLIVGSRTAGMPDDVFGLNLPGEVNCSIVGVLVRAFDGSEIFNKGINPDVEVNPSLQSLINDKDEVLEQAIKMLKK